MHVLKCISLHACRSGYHIFKLYKGNLKWQFNYHMHSIQVESIPVSPLPSSWGKHSLILESSSITGNAEKWLCRKPSGVWTASCADSSFQHLLPIPLSSCLPLSYFLLGSPRAIPCCRNQLCIHLGPAECTFSLQACSQTALRMGVRLGRKNLPSAYLLPTVYRSSFGSPPAPGSAGKAAEGGGKYFAPTAPAFPPVCPLSLLSPCMTPHSTTLALQQWVASSNN